MSLIQREPACKRGRMCLVPCPGCHGIELDDAPRSPAMSETKAVVERLRGKLRERAGFMREAGHIDDAELDEEASDLIERLEARAEAAEAERDESDNALVDRYRNPKTGVFSFPGDVAAIVRRLDTAEAERDALAKALEPSAETKAAYMGEFTIAVERVVNEDMEPEDDGAEDPYEHITVPWTTIKQVMSAIRTRALSTLTKEPAAAIREDDNG